MTKGIDTICAVATPPGKGGIGIIRISGPESHSVATKVTGLNLSPRHAHFGPFISGKGEVIDEGITLYFPGPDSFTGEDTVELQAHGGPYVMDLLLQEILTHGPRLARPGEFSERAFINDKIDLTQAEAIADLIESHSTEAARFAVRSLQGEFSSLVNDLINSIIELRKYVEAALDFPEEEVDFLASGEVASRLNTIHHSLQNLLDQAKQGSIMKEGLSVVIAGKPNAGKSSLLNKLAGESRAIVTEVAGTTRDTLKEHISINGMPLHIIDTAGLHDSDDLVEREGIKRAWAEIDDADLILLVSDSSASSVSTSADFSDAPLWKMLREKISDPAKLMLVFNKADLSEVPVRIETFNDSMQDSKTGSSDFVSVTLSAKTGDGLDLLKQAIADFAGINQSVEGRFIARRRHLNALTRAFSFMTSARDQLSSHRAGELVAEDLKKAHQSLEEITGAYTPDDLLGEIFSSFCIGK